MDEKWPESQLNSPDFSLDRSISVESVILMFKRKSLAITGKIIVNNNTIVLKFILNSLLSAQFKQIYVTLTNNTTQNARYISKRLAARNKGIKFHV